MTPAKIQVRFADCDMMGHVNNAVYLSYFEQARMHYFGQMVGAEWDWNKDGIILAKNVVEYVYPVFLHDKPEIIIYLKEIGDKSFTLSYKVLVNEKLCTKGESTLVCFDFVKNTSVSIFPKMMEGLKQLEKL